MFTQDHSLSPTTQPRASPLTTRSPPRSSRLTQVSASVTKSADCKGRPRGVTRPLKRIHSNVHPAVFESPVQATWPSPQVVSTGRREGQVRQTSMFEFSKRLGTREAPPATNLTSAAPFPTKRAPNRLTLDRTKPDLDRHNPCDPIPKVCIHLAAAPEMLCRTLLCKWSAERSQQQSNGYMKCNTATIMGRAM